MFQTEVVEKIKTHVLCPIYFFSEHRAVYETTWKHWYSRTNHRWQCNIPKGIASATKTLLIKITQIWRNNRCRINVERLLRNFLWNVQNQPGAKQRTSTNPDTSGIAIQNNSVCSSYQLLTLAEAWDCLFLARGIWWNCPRADQHWQKFS